MRDAPNQQQQRQHSSLDARLATMDALFAEMEPGRRVYRAGAWNLGGPGVYTRVSPEGVTIGHRPGALHWAIAIVFPLIAVGVICLIPREAWWISAAIALLFGVVPLLPLLNTQRYEIARGFVRARGRALGFPVDKRWPLTADAGVRVETVPQWEDGTRWTCYQAQIRVAEGWIALAEYLHDPEPVRAFARQVAHAAGVPLLEAEPPEGRGSGPTD